MHNIYSFIIEELSLYNFRNYSDIKLNFSSTPSIITGNNGAGKTNILEAISFLSPGKGFRNCNLEQVPSKDYDHWKIKAKVNHGGILSTIEVLPEIKNDKITKITKINGEKATGENILDNIRVMWLLPQTSYIFTLSNSEKRYFLDKLIVNQDKAHLGRLSSYETAVRERNKMLKQGIKNDAWFVALEKIIAEKSVSLAFSRLKYIEKLNIALQDISGIPKIHLQILGKVEKILQNNTALKAEEDIQKILKETREQDRMQGGTGIGAHKSEFTGFNLDKELSISSSSTGEQKLAVIGIMMAHNKLVTLQAGMHPILLLDEVFSHLDSENSLKILKEILEGSSQIFLSAANGDFIKKITKKVNLYEIKNNIIKKQLSAK